MSGDMGYTGTVFEAQYRRPDGRSINPPEAIEGRGLKDPTERKNMTELEKLKKMLVDAHDQMRTRKQKNTPTFGAMMFMLEAIVQCNKALGERKKDGQNKIQT